MKLTLINSEFKSKSEFESKSESESDINYSNENKFLIDLINKEYLSYIIMYKTWDNDYARKICKEIMEKIKISLLQENICFFSSKNLKENFCKLKEFCEHGCIHLDLHLPIEEILFKSR
jgi:hypothetical protein